MVNSRKRGNGRQVVSTGQLKIDVQSLVRDLGRADPVEIGVRELQTVNVIVIFLQFLQLSLQLTHVPLKGLQLLLQSVDLKLQLLAFFEMSLLLRTDLLNFHALVVFEVLVQLHHAFQVDYHVQIFPVL